MNFCAHCGKPLAAITPSVPPAPARVDEAPKPPAEISQEVMKALRPKLADLGKRIHAMSDQEYGDWVNALPPDEFIGFILLAVDEDRFDDRFTRLLNGEDIALAGAHGSGRATQLNERSQEP